MVKQTRSKYQADGANLVIKIGSTLMHVFNCYGDGEHELIQYEGSNAQGVEYYIAHGMSGNWEEIMHIKGVFTIMNYDCLTPEQIDDPEFILREFTDPTAEYVLLRSKSPEDGDFMLIRIKSEEGEEG